MLLSCSLQHASGRGGLQHKRGAQWRLQPGMLAQHESNFTVQLLAAVWPRSQVVTWKVWALLLSGLLVRPNSHVHTASNSKLAQCSVTSYCLIQKLTDAFPVEIQPILFRRDKSTPSSNYFWISPDLATTYPALLSPYEIKHVNDTVWTNILYLVNAYVFIYINIFCVCTPTVYLCHCFFTLSKSI